MENKPVKYAGRYQLKYRGTNCLNCGHPLDISDRYCPQCSQANSTKKLTLKDFIEEFFHSLIEYDSRLLKTVKALLLKPGKISLDYVSGKRVTYTNPFRFLLSLAFIYFLLMGLSGDFTALDRLNLEEQAQKVPEDALNFNVHVDEGDAERAREALMEIDPDIKLDSLNIGREINRQKRIKDSTLAADPKGYLESSGGGFLGRVVKKTDAFMNLIRMDTIYTFEEGVTRYGIDASWENRISFSTARSVRRAMRQPGSFLNDLFSRLPFATFFFLPIFSIFITLVYIRKKYTYTDNLVFSFHIQSLFFILLIIGYLTDSLIGLNIYWLCFLVFAIYLFIAMRRFYKQGIFKTILKYLFLNTIFVILATMAALALLLGSAVTY